MANLRNFTGCVTATMGTGTLVLGAAMPGHRTFDAAYAASAVVSYTIVDGNNREAGLGTYDKAQNLLGRTTLLNSTTGALLNLSGNAVVFVDLLAQDYSGDWPVLIVSRNAGDNGGFQSASNSNGFFTVALTDVSIDTHGGWDAASYTWVVPQTGLYDLQGKVRPVDTNGTDAGFNFGIGLDIANQDSPGFSWVAFPSGLSANTNRFVGYNSRQMMLTVGQQLRLFTYLDRSGGVSINKAELVATRVR